MTTRTTTTTDGERQARAVLDAIETRLLDALRAVHIDLECDTPQAAQYIISNALTELLGRYLTVLMQDDPAMRPRCLALVRHLELHVSTTGQRVQ